jgi:hypothetical protein
VNAVGLNALRYDDDVFIMVLLPKLQQRIHAHFDDVHADGQVDILSHIKLINRLKGMMKQGRDMTDLSIPAPGTVAAMEATAHVAHATKTLSDLVGNADGEEGEDVQTDYLATNMQAAGKKLTERLLVDHEGQGEEYIAAYNEEVNRYSAVYDGAAALSSAYETNLLAAGEELLLQDCDAADALAVLHWGDNLVGNTQGVAWEQVLVAGDAVDLAGDAWKADVVRCFTALSGSHAQLNKVYEDYSIHSDERQTALVKRADEVLKKLKTVTIEHAIFAAAKANSPKRAYSQIKTDMSTHSVMMADVSAPLRKKLTDALGGAAAAADAGADGDAMAGANGTRRRVRRRMPN